MKRLLLPLLATLALPISVNAKTWHLLVKGSRGAMVQYLWNQKSNVNKQVKRLLHLKNGKEMVFFYLFITASKENK